MTRPTRFCRVAWIVNDLDTLVIDLRKYLGLGMRFSEMAKDIIKVGIDEHGLEPIELIVDSVEFMADQPAPLVEIALAVHDAPATRARLSAAGIEPSFTSPLPGPDTEEYLYGGNKFYGLPLMVCTDGDNESMMMPFRDLEEAPAPKVGCVTMLVDSIDKIAADFNRFFDMTFVETDAGGYGARAVVGAHRVKLVERPDPALVGEFMRSMIATEMMFDDVEATRRSLESAGFSVLRERTYKSGRKGYYFGATFERLPLYIYATADDNENRGLA